MRNHETKRIGPAFNCRKRDDLDPAGLAIGWNDHGERGACRNVTGCYNRIPAPGCAARSTLHWRRRSSPRRREEDGIGDRHLTHYLSREQRLLPYRMPDPKLSCRTVRADRFSTQALVGFDPRVRGCRSTRSARPSKVVRSKSSALARRRLRIGFSCGRGPTRGRWTNWVVQGLIRRLVKDDAEAQRFLRSYCVYIMPMANKDGVARGRTVSTRMART